MNTSTVELMQRWLGYVRWYHKNVNPLEYLHLQMRLEGKEPIHEHFMRQVEIVPDEEMPLILMAQLANGEMISYFAETIPTALYKDLASNRLGISFPQIHSLLSILRSHGIGIEVGHYKTYVFPSQPEKDVEIICFSKHDPKVKAFGFEGFAENVYALERDGNIVSACVSTRENKKCGEAWVYTDVAFRNQGFAQKAVKAWAGSLMDKEKVPFYSHSLDNAASASLANKLGLQPMFEEIAITQI